MYHERWAVQLFRAHRPLIGVDARIGQERCAPGKHVGEIWVHGPNTAAGYWRNSERSQDTFGGELAEPGDLPAGPWMKTGDYGVVHEGELYVTGRIKELIIKGGENIAPREIDEALLKHPAVLEAATVGIPDAFYGQEIMACVVLKPGAACSSDELMRFSQGELGQYKTPRLIKFVEQLPKGPSGKVQRLKLLEI